MASPLGAKAPTQQICRAFWSTSVRFTWLLCEGPSEFVLLRYFAEAVGTPLDQKGVSVIDFQNNGAPAALVKLARAFEIPWMLSCDNDQAGQGYIETVSKLGLTDAEKKDLLRPLPGTGMDLELFLVQSSLLPGSGKIVACEQTANTLSATPACRRDPVS